MPSLEALTFEGWRCTGHPSRPGQSNTLLNRCCATNTALGRQRRPATEKPHQPLLRVRLVWPGRRQSVAALTGWRVHRAWARCRVV